MRIIVGDAFHDVPDGATVKDVLVLLDERVERVLVELNGSYVPPQSHARTRLRQGDRMEIIEPAPGG
jgi:thiamine biosynthesis protein ThiS